jgi:hypothetical protein
MRGSERGALSPDSEFLTSMSALEKGIAAGIPLVKNGSQPGTGEYGCYRNRNEQPGYETR